MTKKNNAVEKKEDTSPAKVKSVESELMEKGAVSQLSSSAFVIPNLYLVQSGSGAEKDGMGTVGTFIDMSERVETKEGEKFKSFGKELDVIIFGADEYTIKKCTIFDPTKNKAHTVPERVNKILPQKKFTDAKGHRWEIYPTYAFFAVLPDEIKENKGFCFPYRLIMRKGLRKDGLNLNTALLKLLTLKKIKSQDVVITLSPYKTENKDGEKWLGYSFKVKRKVTDEERKATESWIKQYSTVVQAEEDFEETSEQPVQTQNRPPQNNFAQGNPNPTYQGNNNLNNFNDAFAYAGNSYPEIQ